MRRLSHAEAGRRFFVSLDAARRQLRQCEDALADTLQLIAEDAADLALSRPAGIAMPWV